MRANGAEVTFIPLKMEAERGRETEGRREKREQRAKGGAQRWGIEREGENAGDSAHEGETRERVGSGRVDVGEKGRGHQGHTRVLEVCWRLDSL